MTTTIKTITNTLRDERITLTYSVYSEMYRITTTNATSVITKLYSNIKHAVTTYNNLIK